MWQKRQNARALAQWIDICVCIEYPWEIPILLSLPQTCDRLRTFSKAVAWIQPPPLLPAARAIERQSRCAHRLRPLLRGRRLEDAFADDGSG